MKAGIIYGLMDALKSNTLDFEDLEKLAFYEGAFYAFADLAKKGNLDEVLFRQYLIDFLEDETRVEALEEYAPEMLAELKDLIASLENIKKEEKFNV